MFNVINRVVMTLATEFIFLCIKDLVLFVDIKNDTEVMFTKN